MTYLAACHLITMLRHRAARRRIAERLLRRIGFSRSKATRAAMWTP